MISSEFLSSPHLKISGKAEGAHPVARRALATCEGLAADSVLETWRWKWDRCARNSHRRRQCSLGGGTQPAADREALLAEWADAEPSRSFAAVSASDSAGAELLERVLTYSMALRLGTSTTSAGQTCQIGSVEHAGGPCEAMLDRQVADWQRRDSTHARLDISSTAD